MSREDAIKKAVAAALNPKTFNFGAWQRRAARSEDAGDATVAAQWVELVAAFGLSPELGRVLWSLKYAQHAPTEEALVRATALLAERLNGRGGLLRRRPTPTYLRMLSAAILEWVHDECPRCTGGRLWSGGWLRCGACDGHGFQPLLGAPLEERGRGGRQHRLSKPCATCGGLCRVPVGSAGSRPEKGYTCPSCGGSNAVRLTDLQRAQQLGVSPEVYLGKSWAVKYEQALNELRAVDRGTAILIDAELRRGTTAGERTTDRRYI